VKDSDRSIKTWHEFYSLSTIVSEHAIVDMEGPAFHIEEIMLVVDE
jgi:hypothetical protein